MTIPAERPLCAKPTARSAAERTEGAETGWADATGTIRLMAMADHTIMPVATKTRVCDDMPAPHYLQTPVLSKRHVCSKIT